jgi:hypothetical protein
MKSYYQGTIDRTETCESTTILLVGPICVRMEIVLVIDLSDDQSDGVPVLSLIVRSVRICPNRPVVEQNQDDITLLL